MLAMPPAGCKSLGFCQLSLPQIGTMKMSQLLLQSSWAL